MRTWIIAAALTLPLAPAAATAQPQTRAEVTAFKETSRNADVMAFVRELQRGSSKIRVESLGTSTEGYDIPMLVLGDPVPASPVDLNYDDRTVVYIQANIHAGEVEGKEAVLMLARDILRGKTSRYLDRLVVLLVPNFNPDGNEKISTENRTNQHGPEGGVGIRYNGQNLDLNRDGVKLETPEVRGLVARALSRWDPVLFLDAHTHNGSYHQEPVTWTWGLNPNGDRRIIDFMAYEMWPAVESRMRDEHGIDTIPHGDFMDPTEPEKGWTPLPPNPRFLSNYVGLRNRLSILNEQYPYVDFEARVRGCYALLLSVLDFVHENRDRVVELVAAADHNASRRGLDREPGSFVVESEWRPLREKLTIQGYDMEVTQERGRRRVRPLETRRVYENVPYYADFAPTRSVPLPRGYLLSVRDEAVLDNLRGHGIAVDRLVEPAALEVEAFTVNEVTRGERWNQGHLPSRVVGEYGTQKIEAAAGSYYVRTAQPLGALAAALLEPESDDGLVYWNFFDRYLGSQWGRGPWEYPVFKLHGSDSALVTEPVP